MHTTYRLPALALVALLLAGHGEVEGEGGERRHRRRDDFPDRLPRTKKKKGRGEGPLEETEVRNEKVVAKTRLAEGKHTYDTLKAALLKANDEETRGLLGAGKKVASNVKTATFKPDPVPVMSATVIYYRL